MIKEGDYDWERKGEPIVDIIQEYAHIEPEPAEDIRSVLEDRHYDRESMEMGEEGLFDEDAHYAEADVDDAESQAGWLHFEESLKTEARYFSRTAEWTLKDIFEGITEHQTHDGRPIVVEAGPGARIDAIYRARVFQSADKLKNALGRPDKEIGPPPSKIALAGRMNAYGISVFYGATDQTVALAEVRPPVGSRVVVGRFELIRPVRLLDVEALRVLNVEGSVFDPSYRSRLEKAKFLKWLSRRIALPVMPDDESYDYIPTQAIADFLASNANPLLHGILYPSVQCGSWLADLHPATCRSRIPPLRGGDPRALFHVRRSESRDGFARSGRGSSGGKNRRLAGQSSGPVRYHRLSLPRVAARGSEGRIRLSVGVAGTLSGAQVPAHPLSGASRGACS